MGEGYYMYLLSASLDTIRGVVPHDTLRIIREVVWSDKVRRLMRAKGVTQAALMPVLGVTTRGAVGHYLSGRRKMTPEQFYALTKRLGVRVDELFEDAASDPGETREAPAPYDVEDLRVARAIRSLPPKSRVALQTVLNALAKSAPWDGLERRKGEKP